MQSSSASSSSSSASLSRNYFPFSPFRAGFWRLNVGGVDPFIGLIISRTPEMTTLKLALNSLQKGVAEMSGKDIYLHSQEFSLPSRICHLITPAFALSPTAFFARRTPPSQNTFCLRTLGPVDDLDDLFDGMERFREAVQSSMTSNIPVKRLRRVVIPMTFKVFSELFAAFKIKPLEIASSFGEWTYTPDKSTPLPTPDEYKFFANVAKVTPTKAYEMIQEYKRTPSTSSLVIMRGSINRLKARVKSAGTKFKEASNSQVTKTSQEKTNIFRAELDAEKILELESCVGSFTKKAVRGSVIPTRIIGLKKPNDPSYVPECQMRLTFHPKRSQLVIEFNYIIRDELGNAY